MQSTVLAALAVALRANVPVLLWGPPGTGKSATVAALGQQLGWPTEVVIASLREPSDFAGLPVVERGQVRLAPPAWARRLAEAQTGLLFLDEISTAPPAVQAALLRVVLDRVVGDLALPPTVRIVAAANPPEQAAGGWDLAPPLANRFLHLHWPLDTQRWCAGMLSGFALGALPTVPDLPPDPQARALVAGFVAARPHLLLAVPDDPVKASGAWPSPRSWDLAARLLGLALRAGAGREVELTLVAGAVGEGAAGEFFTWRQTLDLPDPESLLAEPEKFRLPERSDQQYAVLAAVVSAVLQQPTRERWDAGWRILHTATTTGARDLVAALSRELILLQRRQPNLPLPTATLLELYQLLQEARLL